LALDAGKRKLVDATTEAVEPISPLSSEGRIVLGLLEVLLLLLSGMGFVDLKPLDIASLGLSSEWAKEVFIRTGSRLPSSGPALYVTSLMPLVPMPFCVGPAKVS